jgi:hypothetical protein
MRVLATVAVLTPVAGLMWWCNTAQAYRPFDGTDGAVADTEDGEIELEPTEYMRKTAEGVLFAPDFRVNYGFASDCLGGWFADLRVLGDPVDVRLGSPNRRRYQGRLRYSVAGQISQRTPAGGGQGRTLIIDPLTRAEAALFGSKLPGRSPPAPSELVVAPKIGRPLRTNYPVPRAGAGADDPTRPANLSSGRATVARAFRERRRCLPRHRRPACWRS